MSDAKSKLPTRRAALRSFGGALLAAGYGVRVRAGTFDGPLVDAHVHLVNTNLPGVRGGRTTPDGETVLPPYAERAEALRREMAEAVGAEMKAAGVAHALCMPRRQLSDDDPLGIRETVALAELVNGPKLHAVGFAHPERFDDDHMSLVEGVLKQGEVKALKAYLGYLGYGPYFRGYIPYYELAGKYEVPVVFHTGDTYSRTAKVKYAHPLAIDEVAVDFPDTTFVMAHFGNPWIMDAAELLYKNKNVYADLSGILIGDAEYFADAGKRGALKRTVERINGGIAFAESAENFFFGSDWPLAPFAEYRNFVASMFPEEQHAAVFGGNAKRVFKL